jgi:hypothetical protein
MMSKADSTSTFFQLREPGALPPRAALLEEEEEEELAMGVAGMST